MKTCCRCKESKYLEQFNKRTCSSDGMDFACKDCRKIERKSREQRTKVIQKQWYDNIKIIDKDYSRKKALKTRFGLSLEEYNAMLNKQNGKCAICSVDMTSLIKNLSVDHCHKTGKVRGLLCQKCNLGIGYLMDDLNLVFNAYEYLKIHHD